MVFYRKYRPQTIDELDNTVVRERLTAVLKERATIPHAFLFTGPKGLGKTSSARIIAKVVNCTGQKANRGVSGIEPCNVCDDCVSITNGTNLDVLEIDAASNRGIDEIRELKEKIKLAPLRATKKVYIIDEVHMLTTEAFNALLKTLEEPPDHALFLLCTTEPQKVPPTILSRTFHIAFQKATEDELIRSFSRIIKAEKITISQDALERIALLSDGGFRDGAKMLEEVSLLANKKKITLEFLEENYSAVGVSMYVPAFISALAGHDTKEAMIIVGKVTGEGNDSKFFAEQVIHALHAALLASVGVTESPSSTTALSNLTIGQLKQLLSLFSSAVADMRYSILPQLPLELAVLTWGQRETDVVDTVTEAVITETVVVQKGKTVEGLRKETGNIQKQHAMHPETVIKKKNDQPEIPPANVSVLHFSAKGDITPEWLQDFWSAIIAEVKKHNHTLAGVLRGCMIKSFDRKTLVIETAYTFHREKLIQGNTKETLEEICRTLTGNPVSITIELKTN